MGHWLDKVLELLTAETCDLRELAKIAGVDPKDFYRGANFRSSELTDEDIRGLNLIGAIVDGRILATQSSADTSDVISPADVDLQSIYRSNSISIEKHIASSFSVSNLYLSYSPVFSLSKDNRIGCDTLHSIETCLRYSFDERIISPSEIIPILEDHDLMEIVDSWIFNRSCGAFSRWKRSNIIEDRVLLNVNVSTDRILSAGFVDQTNETLYRRSINPQELLFDIFEPLDVNHVPIFKEKLQSIGCQLAIDNFGTNFSDPDTLDTLSPEYIKIDRSYIHSMRKDDLNTNIEIASQFATDGVICTGIESDAMLRISQSLGCTIFSGYYFCAPMNFGDMNHFLCDLLQKGPVDVREIVLR